MLYSALKLPVLHRSIWALALPAMLANVATALFGVADLWVIGQLGDAPAQGAVELGAKLMVGLLGLFNFLRTGTVALTAQSLGRNDAVQHAVLLRGLVLGLVLACVLLIFKSPILDAAMRVFSAGPEVDHLARNYVGIRYWALPAWLACAALTGWLIGHQRVRTIFWVEVGVNAVHVLLDLLFVLVFHWGVEGVAAASLMSEWLRLVILLTLALRGDAKRSLARAVRDRVNWQAAAWLGLLRMNRDLFIRTLLLTASIWMLTRGGATQGADILAANGIIFLLFSVATLVLDGFEVPAQVLCGQALGRGDRPAFRRLVLATSIWGLLAGLLLSLFFVFAAATLGSTFSTDPDVIRQIHSYAVWLWVLPLAGTMSFVLDGVFIGSGWTRAMLWTMAASFICYVGALYGLRGLGNHGLWLAYVILLLTRATGQLLALPGLTRRSFKTEPATTGAAV